MRRPSRHALIAAGLLVAWAVGLALVGGPGLWSARERHADRYLREFAPTAAADTYVVGAYLYLWYGPRGAHWEGSARQPALGQYDSADPGIIARQIDWATGHGVDLFVVSWWGPASHEDRVLQTSVLPGQLGADVKLAVIYESTGRLAGPDGRMNLDTPESREHLVSDFRYLAEHYFGAEQYLQVDGRPLVVLYAARDYQGDVPAALDAARAAARQAGYDPYLVGDEVDWRDPSAVDWRRLRSYDAVTAYSMYAPDLALLSDFEARVASQYAAWAAAGRRFGVPLIPGAGPGYDDTKVRPHDAHPALARSPDRFGRQVDLALASIDPGLRMLLITSWNEWLEDTAIEPAIDLGFGYLDVLRDRLRLAAGGER